MAMWYKLADDGRTPVPAVPGEGSLDIDSRRVAYDKVGEAGVSTVFLGLDHNLWGGGDPLLWETMIFGGDHDQYCERYSTYDDAVAGHAKAVQIAQGTESPS
jgi:hypothetical protein